MPVKEQDLEKFFLGKTIVEAVPVLSTLPWYLKSEGQNSPAEECRITALTLVSYQTKRLKEAKKSLDLLVEVEASSGIYLLDQFSPQTRRRSDLTIGITSRVRLNSPSFNQGKRRYAHLPFIDLDFEASDLPDEQILEVVKAEIKEKTQFEKGLIFSSGRRAGNFHFIGLGRLLTEDQLVTFAGLSLDMDYQGRPMVDPFWVGHNLNSMGCLDYGSMVARYATLRLTANELKPEVPRVIDVMV